MSGGGDDSLADLVEELTRILEAGERVDLERLTREHPELAGELEALVPALAAVDRFGREVESGDAGILGESGLLGPSDLSDAPVSGHDGRRTLGDYHILREIGRGGMGIVYEAEQLSLGRRVALKVLPFAAVLDQRQIQRFRNEAQAAAQLHHGNIVPVYAVGCERGVHYYAMQFIDGQPLDCVIAELRRLEKRDCECDAAGTASSTSPAGTASTTSAATCLAKLTPTGSIRNTAFALAAAGLGIQAADALEHAHAAGIVHRDIKPANLLLDARGRLWVTDFGLARCRGTDGITLTGDVLGTLRYMSPEQALARHAQVDQRTDVYSLGASLYELLTGEPVFGGRDRQEVLRRLALEDPRPLRRLNPAVPADLETIVLKTLEKEPWARYATAAALRDDLRRYLEDRPIGARRPGPLRTLWKWVRRHRAASIALAVIALAVSASLGAWSIAAGARREYAEREFRAILREAAVYSQPKPLAAVLADLGRADELAPGTPEVPYYRARAHYAAGDEPGAMREVDVSLTRDPEFTPAQALRTQLLVRGNASDETWSAGMSYLIDDFADGDDFGWARGAAAEAGASPIFDASGGSYRLARSREVPSGRSAWLWSTWDGGLADGKLRCAVRIDSGDTGAGIILRSNGDFRGYEFFVNTWCSCIGVERCDGPSNCADAWFVPDILVAENEVWLLELGTIGDQISIKAWREGEPEPAAPQLSVRDDRYPSGKVRINAGATYHQSPIKIDVTFDDFSFTPANACLPVTSDRAAESTR